MSNVTINPIEFARQIVARTPIVGVSADKASGDYHYRAGVVERDEKLQVVVTAYPKSAYDADGAPLALTDVFAKDDRKHVYIDATVQDHNGRPVVMLGNYDGLITSGYLDGVESISVAPSLIK